MIRTPVCDFIEKYRSNKTRFHMPGHKGVGSVERDDITEIRGADVLYSPSGIILQSEKIASEIFGSKATFFSTEGSSLLIRAAVYLVKKYKSDEKKCVKIAAARNVHSSFVSACALSDVNPVWIYGESESLMSCKILGSSLDAFLREEKPDCLYITSPDYLGCMADIKKIADVCHKNGVLLIVDNAHGAYLKFIGKNTHPLDCGADICIESAHKTLPCLTGTAYLHFGESCPDYFVQNANDAIRLFASTSPSYLLIASLDRFNGLAESYAEMIISTSSVISEVKKSLSEAGYELCGDEPLKITLKPKSYGYTGDEIADVLEKQGIIVEFFDKDYVTLMISPYNKKSAIQKTLKVLKSIPKKTAVSIAPPKVVVGKRALSIREAVFSKTEEVRTDIAKGRVLAELCVSCPPAVPILCCGEIISDEAVSAFEYYGVNTLKVVK